MPRGVGHADHATPVMHQERDAASNAELVNQRFQIINAALQCIWIALFIRLVRQPAADVIGGDHPMGPAQTENQIAEKK